MSKVFTALGTMSGTSFDGIDLSIIITDGKKIIKIKKDFYYPYNPSFIDKLRKFKRKIQSIDKLSSIANLNSFKEISNEVTRYHLKAVKKIISKTKKKIDIIGFHGITVMHRPKNFFTLQLGNPLFLKKKLKTNIIFNFRKNDLENGGEGAPLTPIYHKAIVKKLKNKNSSVFINIGGISNLTFVSGNKFKAYDIGPGNCLLDQWINFFSKKKFDVKGSISRKGNIDYLIADSFIKKLIFLKKKNISFDTSDFSLNEFKDLKFYDGAATLAYITGKIIANSINDLQLDKNSNVYLTGGGRKNLTIFKNIKKKYF